MPPPLRVLIVEDSEDDELMLLQVLSRGGFEVTHERVDSAQTMRAALEGRAWDIVISDHNMPGFNAIRALELRGQFAPDVPFIIVSGGIGEEAAAEAMRMGASDYVMKGNLTRLAPAIGRELLDARMRLESRRSEKALRESENVKSAILESSLDCVITIDEAGNIVEFNPAAEATFGFARADVQGKPLVDLIIPEHYREAHKRGFANYLATGEGPIFGKRLEMSAIRADGTEFPIELAITAIRTDTAHMFTGFIRDISERKRNEEDLRRFRLAMDNSADMILLIDRETMLYIDVNPAVCRLLGYSREELLSMTPDRILPVSLADLEKSYDELIANPDLKGAMASYYLCKDGSRLPFESTRHVLRSGEGWLIAAISRDIRERLAIERERGRTEQELRRFQLAMDMSVDTIYLTDPQSMRFVYVNDAACRRLGYTREDLLHMGPQKILAKSADEMRREFDKVIEAGERGLRFENRFTRSDGSDGWTELDRRAIVSEGAPLIVTIGRDITERRAAEIKVKHLNRVYAVLSGINSAIVRIRDRKELFSETCRIAVSAGGFVMARVVELDAEGKARIAASTESDPRAFEQVVQEFNRNPGSHSLLAQALRSGRPMVSNDIATDERVIQRAELTQRGSYALALLPMKVGGRMAGVIILRSREPGMFDAEEMKLLTELAGDVSFALEHIEKSDRVAYLALYDPLTGLANRTLFLERLNQSAHTAGQTQGKIAVALLDVERLRSINESLGRQAGDAVLKELAQRLTVAAGSTEVSRVAADQFAVKFEGMKGRSEMGRIVEGLVRKCVGTAFSVSGTELRIGAKAGISQFPAHGVDAEVLLRKAEAALRTAKQTGEQTTFFTRDLTETTSDPLTLENKLRQALDKQEFVLHYQPKVDLMTRAIAGVEALIRWHSPELGLVPPMKFIPLMEETGMILDVGAWALARAAADHLRWTQMGIAAPRVAVNVSAIQLRKKDFLEMVKAAIRRGANPPGIDLEITESLIMEDIEGNIRKLKEVRSLGMGIAIDDFGTGYSSLAYLAKLPVQILKIDRSFVITMLDNPDTMTLVQTVISLAHSLRLKVVAEGVDLEAQANVLRLLRCDEMQGYLFSPPLPFEQMTALLAQG